MSVNSPRAWFTVSTASMVVRFTVILPVEALLSSMRSSISRFMRFDCRESTSR